MFELLVSVNYSCLWRWSKATENEKQKAAVCVQWATRQIRSRLDKSFNDPFIALESCLGLLPRLLIYRTPLSISSHFAQQTIGWLENLLPCTIMRSMASIFNNQTAQAVLLFYMKINIFSFHCAQKRGASSANLCSGGCCSTQTFSLTKITKCVCSLDKSASSS